MGQSTFFLYKYGLFKITGEKRSIFLAKNCGQCASYRASLKDGLRMHIRTNTTITMFYYEIYRLSHPALRINLLIISVIVIDWS